MRSRFGTVDLVMGSFNGLLGGILLCDHRAYIRKLPSVDCPAAGARDPPPRMVGGSRWETLT